MPMISGGHKTLVRYPDGTSVVITLYALPLRGQIIAHGWEVTNVAPGADDVAGVPIEHEISVARPTERTSGDGPSAFIVTRIHVGDYDTWKPMFDKDEPGTRHTAKGHRRQSARIRVRVASPQASSNHPANAFPTVRQTGETGATWCLFASTRVRAAPCRCR